MPTQYVSFDYTVMPGTTTGATPLVLPVTPGTCQQSSTQINVAASQGVAAINFMLSGTATLPYQNSLQITTQTSGIAIVTMEIPLSIDGQGNTSDPFAFTTTMPGNGLTCYLSLGGPNLFTSFDGDFQCSTLSTSQGHQLMLTQGHFHAVPCPSS
jgi:hypothetical protein